MVRSREIGVLASLGEWPDDPVGGRPAPAARHRALLEQGVLAEALGFDAFWLGEPPDSDGVRSAPAVVLAAIAARTARLRLGATVARLRDLDPIDVAEAYATLDGISGGRIELAARDTDPGEARGPRSEEDRERFRENLLLLRRLWSETEVTWSGRFRPPLHRVTLEPRPLQRPHPSLWIGGSTRPMVDLAAELGLPLMLPDVRMVEAAALVDRYRERAAAAGHAPGALRLGACYEVAIPGTPDEIVDRLLASCAALGLDLQLLVFDLGRVPEAELRRALERFAAEALPQLRSAGAS